MNEILTIRCPFCGAWLKVMNQLGIESKNVACPVCNCRKRFPEFIYDGSALINADNTDKKLIGNQIYHIDYPYCISVNVLADRVLTLKKNETSDNPIKEEVLKTLKRVGNLNSDEKESDDFYLCPQCGNILTVKSYPKEFGDDYICECRYCQNTFVFGGTYSMDYVITPLENLSAHPLELARKTLFAKATSIAETTKDKILPIGDTIVTLRDTGTEIHINRIFKLYR